MEETLLKDYLKKKQTGGLLVDKAMARSRAMEQVVPHSFHADGLVRFGDTIQLRSAGTTGVLASNVWEPLGLDAGEQYGVTTGAGAARPVSRNTFVVTRCEPTAVGPRGPVRPVMAAAGEDPDVLRYGEQFMLACNPSLRIDESTGYVKPPLYVQSQIVSHGRAAKLSNKQLVCLQSGRPTYSMVWRVQRPASRTFRPDGDAVAAGEEFVLVHCATGSTLNSTTKFGMRTDFGQEFEVSCHTLHSTGKTHNLSREWAGVTTGDDPIRQELSGNHFSFVLSADAAAARDSRRLVSLTPAMILENVKAKVNERGAYGIRGLARSFRIMDDSGDGRLSKVEFRYGLGDYGVSLSDADFEAVMTVFDRNGDGMVTLSEFLRALRGPLSPSRRAIIAAAFRVLDANGNGVVTLEDIAARYNTSTHPDVVSGRRTEKSVFAEFLGNWDVGRKDGLVTEEEFQSYYEDISASIDADEYFELLMRNAWHIAGGQGAAENTANRRVLCTFRDGSQRVVGLRNDLGLGSDLQKIMARLREEGVDCVKVSLAD